MSLFSPQDTMAYHRARPLTTPHKMAISMNDLREGSAAYSKAHHADSAPETEALYFYGMNHGVALIEKNYVPLETLPEDVNEFVNEYYKTCSKMAQRAFYYLLLICTRESRHLHNLPSFGTKQGNACGQDFRAFSEHIRASGSGSAVSKLHAYKFTQSMSVLRFVEGLRWTFYNGPFSGGYGGPNWGAVTDCLHKFVRGEYTAELMLDTVWTLAHNNGPIFNKGMLYTPYTSYLYEILDVQRSGQIPEMVLHHAPTGQFNGDKLFYRMEWLTKKYPTELGKYVDWFKVEALGAVKSWSAYKDQQLKKHGETPWAAELGKMNAATAAKNTTYKKNKDKTLNTSTEEEVDPATVLTIMPGVVVKKIARPKAA